MPESSEDEDSSSEEDSDNQSSKVCSYCGEDFGEDYPFTCKYCGEKFCGEHRLPESHDCSEVEKEKRKVMEGKKPMFPKKTKRTENKRSISSSRSSPRRGSSSLGLESWFLKNKDLIAQILFGLGVALLLIRHSIDLVPLIFIVVIGALGVKLRESNNSMLRVIGWLLIGYVAATIFLFIFSAGTFWGEMRRAALLDEYFIGVVNPIAEFFAKFSEEELLRGSLVSFAASGIVYKFYKIKNFIF